MRLSACAMKPLRVEWKGPRDLKPKGITIAPEGRLVGFGDDDGKMRVLLFKGVSGAEVRQLADAFAQAGLYIGAYVVRVPIDAEVLVGEVEEKCRHVPG
jgi:hypothetical protein